MTRFIIIALVALTMACVSPQRREDEPAALLPSEMLARAEQLDGHMVLLRGYVVIGSEGWNVFDSQEAFEHGGVCLGISGSERMLSRQRSVNVDRLSGTFRRQLCSPGSICIHWCSASGIVLDRNARF